MLSSVEEQAAGPQQATEVVVEAGQRVRLEPMERGGAEHRVYLRCSQRLQPVGRGEIGLDPAQAAVDRAERAASDGQHHRIDVHRDRLRAGEAGEQPLTDRSRAAGEIQRDERCGQQLSQRVERRGEPRFALRNVAFLLRVPALQPVEPVDLRLHVGVSADPAL